MGKIDVDDKGHTSFPPERKLSLNESLKSCNFPGRLAFAQKTQPLDDTWVSSSSLHIPAKRVFHWIQFVVMWPFSPQNPQQVLFLDFFVIE